MIVNYSKFRVLLTAVALTLSPLGAIALPPYTPKAIAQYWPTPDPQSTLSPEIQQALQAAVWGYSARRPDEGIRRYETLFQLLHQAGDYGREADLLANLGKMVQQEGRLERALGYLERSQVLFQQLRETGSQTDEQRSQEVAVLNQIGTVRRLLGQPEAAMAAYQQALAISTAVNDVVSTEDTLKLIAVLQRIQGQLDQALATYQQILNSYPEGFDTYGKAEVFNSVGLLHEQLGNPEAAIAAYQAVLGVTASLEPNLTQIDRVLALNQLVDLYAAQGQTAQAETYRQQAIAVMDENSDDSRLPVGGFTAQTNLLQRIGNALLDQGLAELAERYYQQSLAIADRGYNRYYDQLFALGSIELAYRRQGNLERALDYILQSLTVMQEMGDPNAQSSTFLSLGDGYQALGDLERALGYYQQALAIARADEYGRDDRALALESIGQIYYLQGQLAIALTSYQQSLDLFNEIGVPEHQARLLQQIGAVYQAQGHPDQAESHYQQAEALRNSPPPASP
ncbi:MAG TPA: tetratricopeptide repeat protein [Chroococcidiopsis sp.]